MACLLPFKKFKPKTSGASRFISRKYRQQSRISVKLHLRETIGDVQMVRNRRNNPVLQGINSMEERETEAETEGEKEKEI